MKETSFPTLEGDLFDTFDPVELMSFPNDCGKYAFSVFLRLCASFRNFHLVEGYPLAFIADFGLRAEVICELKLIPPSSNFFEKNSKNGFFVIPVEEKVVSESQA